jgi:hypothetical protein
MTYSQHTPAFSAIERYAHPAAAAMLVERYRLCSNGCESAVTAQFMQFVSEHQYDVHWLKSLFRALGWQQTAKLLDNLMNLTCRRLSSVRQAYQEIAIVRAAFRHMYERGVLGGTDVALLCEHLTSELRGKLLRDYNRVTN